ncbi:MAG: hypothetical protein RTV41_08720 [Candidatus Thorarchaeota archaeon]
MSRIWKRSESKRRTLWITVPIASLIFLVFGIMGLLHATRTLLYFEWGWSSDEFGLFIRPGYWSLIGSSSNFVVVSVLIFIVSLAISRDDPKYHRLFDNVLLAIMFLAPTLCLVGTNNYGNLIVSLYTPFVGIGISNSHHLTYNLTRGYVSTLGGDLFIQNADIWFANFVFLFLGLATILSIIRFQSGHMKSKSLQVLVLLGLSFYIFLIVFMIGSWIFSGTGGIPVMVPIPVLQIGALYFLKINRFEMHDDKEKEVITDTARSKIWTVTSPDILEIRLADIESKKGEKDQT